MLIILDRDGCISVEPLEGDSYRAPRAVSEIDFIPGAREAVAELCRQHDVFIWTSQRATARTEGLRQVTSVNDAIIAQCTQGIPQDRAPRSIICAHDGAKSFCCKPSSKIVEHCRSLLGSRADATTVPAVIVGDGDRDMHSAVLCGVPGILILTNEKKDWMAEHQPEYLANAREDASYVVPDLVAALDIIEVLATGVPYVPPLNGDEPLEPSVYEA